MALYTYCLGNEAMTPQLEEVTGVAGAVARVLQCGEISVVVSDFEGEAVSVKRENVFAHERVIQHVLRYTTPLPFRFGTLASAERLETFVAANRDALVKSLEHVRDSVEMSVKVIWDTEEARRAVGAEQASEEREPEHLELGEGAAYLAAKRLEILEDERLKERAEEVATWLAERVGPAASDRAMHIHPDGSLVIRAAFLVRRESLNDYQKRVEAARRMRAGLRFLTSGPWPPYSFSNINP